MTTGITGIGRRRSIQLAVAAALVTATGGVASAAQSFWDHGANTDYLIDSANYGPVNSHPTSADEAVLDTSHTPAGYTFPDVLYFAGPGRTANFSQAFGAITIDTPNDITFYSTPDNISGRVGLNAGTGTSNILSTGPNFGLNGPQTATIADSPTFGSTLLGLDLLTAGGEGTINVANAQATLVINSVIRNKLSDGAQIHGIEKAGDGTLVLGGANIFGGSNATLGAMQVKLTGGVLQIGADNNLGNSANTVTFNGGTLRSTSATTLTETRKFTVTDNGGGIDLPNAALRINSALTGSGALTKTGAGELQLDNAAGAFTGTIAVNQGNLRLFNAGSLAAGSTVELNGTNSTLNLRNDAAAVTYPVNVNVTKNAQIFVDVATASGVGGVFTIGDINVGSVALNLNGNSTATTASIVTGNVTLSGDATLQVSKTDVTVNGAIGEAGGSHSLKKGGIKTLTLTHDSTFTGPVTVVGGAVAVSSDTQLGAAGAGGNPAPLTLATDLLAATPTTAVLRATASYASNRPLVITDGQVDVGTDASSNPLSISMGPVTGAGTLVKTGAGTLAVSSIQTDGGVNLNNGVVQLLPDSGGSKVNSLVYATGKLDVTNDNLVLDGSHFSTQSVRGLLASGKAGNGGIVTSSVLGPAATTTAVGYLLAGPAQFNVTSWGGVDVVANDVVTRTTYAGDINLDGSVTRDDLALMDAGLAKGITGGVAVWQDGDVNYDGVVDSKDFFLADTAFGVQNGGVLGADLLAERQGQFGSAYVSELVAAVPEPTGLGVVLAAGVLAGRRRRK